MATRLHAGILALCAGTPVLPIAYEFKTHEVFEALGASQFTMDIEDIDSARIVKVFDDFVKWLPANRSAYFEAVIGQARGSRRASELFGGVLSRTRPAS